MTQDELAKRRCFRARFRIWEQLRIQSAGELWERVWNGVWLTIAHHVPDQVCDQAKEDSDDEV
jgi:hypothetical protein